MLREACGYALANRGYNTRDIQVWLGHLAGVIVVISVDSKLMAREDR
jgi:hypothetical protein